MPTDAVPYFLTDTVAVSASGRAIARLEVSVSEEFEGTRLWVTSTGAFSIEALRSSAGRAFSNAKAYLCLSEKRG